MLGMELFVAFFLLAPEQKNTEIPGKKAFDTWKFRFLRRWCFHNVQDIYILFHKQQRISFFIKIDVIEKIYTGNLSFFRLLTQLHKIFCKGSSLIGICI